MKLLLIHPPNTKEVPIGYPRNYSTKARSHLPPLGLLYLAGYLQQYHEVKVLDMMVSKADFEGLSEVLERFQPDIVGITSIIGLWPSVLDVLRTVKQYNPSIQTVVGGPNATQYPVETLSHSNVDYVIVGIGQEPLVQLCNHLEQGKTGEGITNCYRRKKSYVHYHPTYLPDYHLDNFPFPDRTVLPSHHYNIEFCPENPTTTMITSIGCPFKCAFCDCNKQRVQMRSAEKVVDEMEAIELIGIRSILFQDELFTIKPERVRAICEGIIKRKIRLNWSVKSRIDCIRPWMPELMKKAGCFNIHFGIESGNDATLARMKKGYTVAQVREAVKIVKDADLSCTGNFMLAYPGEDEKDVRQTIAFAKELHLDLAQFSLTLDLPNTELFLEAVQAGRRHGNPWSEFVKHPERVELVEMFASDRFSSEKLFEFLDEAYACTRTLFDMHSTDGN